MPSRIPPRRESRSHGNAQGDVSPPEQDGGGRRREVPAGRSRQAGLAAGHRARQRHPPGAQLRRILRVHDLPRDRARGGGSPQRDGAGRGGSPGHGRGADDSLAPRMPGGGAGRRRGGDSQVTLMWRDAEDIGIALSEKFPDVDPLTVRFTDLHRWVTELTDFADDPKASNESTLEKVQMAWLDEYRNRKPPAGGAPRQ